MENKYDVMPRESFGISQKDPDDPKYVTHPSIKTLIFKATLKDLFEEKGLEDKYLILENDLW